MRKLMVLLLAAGLFCVFATPAVALENIFGGYMRTRAILQQDFAGEDQSESQDLQRVDTRTRLYYTAKFSDAFKFVNKFEFNNVWGDTNGGDIGADAANIVVKNSYVDFTLGNVNSKIGIQGKVLNRGFIMDDDASGATFTYNAGDMAIPVFWLKAYEGYNVTGEVTSKNDFDVDYYGINPSLKLGGATVQPIFMWITSKDASEWLEDYNEFDLYYLGADVDMELDAISLWFTGIYQFGSADLVAGGSSDTSAYLVALGGSVGVNALDIHGQIFYATGDDDAVDVDNDAFWVPAGQSYYWSEIMGLGIFDEGASANSPEDQISNIMAANLGVTVKPMDKLSLTADLWYAELAEDNAAGDSVLGTEIDLIATYALMENLKLDVVGAYLFAGDATYKGANDADPYELGTRLSFGF